MCKKIKFKLLNNDKLLQQMYKICCTFVVCLLLLTIVESLFQIPAVKQLFSPENGIGDGMGMFSWIALWVLMFLQVTIIPIPMLPILVLCNKTTLVAKDSSLLSLFSVETMIFVLFCTSAIIAGSSVAYMLGKIFGRNAVKWAAGNEDEFDKWSDAFNSKKGKILYGMTVLFPLFPDDLICIVMGAVKMDFIYFVVIHTICSFIGTFTSILFMRLPYVSIFFNNNESDFPIALVAYIALLIVCTSIMLILKRVLSKKQ